MCHVSRVTCHLSPVTCHMSKIFFLTFSLLKKNYTTRNIGQSGGASQWRVCYQRGLTRLVSTTSHYAGNYAAQFSTEGVFSTTF